MTKILRCRYCERKRKFTGADVQAIMRKIDKSGWVDSPHGDVCNSASCEQLDREQHAGEPE